MEKQLKKHLLLALATSGALAVATVATAWRRRQNGKTARSDITLDKTTGLAKTTGEASTPTSLATAAVAAPSSSSTSAAQIV